LALAGGPVNAGTLCEAMWPKSDPHAATSALRMSVHRLRKQLDDSQAVLSVPGGYELGPHLAVDLLEAESAFAAIRRLTTLEKADHTSLRALFDYIRSAAQTTNVNESWYEKIGYRVDELRHGTGLLLAREYLKRSEPLRALEIGEELLRIDDKDESAVAVCVQSFDAVGDKAAGLRLWQQYVKRLAADYGAKPSIGLDELTAIPR
jgi:DNA-binding SARP family transcriptional activator